MTDRELLKKSLDALEYATDQTKPENLHGCDCLSCTTILALRDRLAQPEAPDVAPEVTPYVIDCPRCGHCCPPRQWVWLTDEDIENIGEKTVAKCSEVDDITGATAILFAKNLESKLREKNT
jgi:hypothetical protein